MRADRRSCFLHSLSNNCCAVVFGANGGLGRALSDLLGSSEQFDQVVALSRASEPPIELEDETQLAHAARYASDCGEIRLIIDATGFLHDSSQWPEKTWRDVEPIKMARVFALNAIGPALLMKHFLPLLPRSGKSVFATLSARVGSIGDNHLGGWYSYRASKAALNQLVRTAAIELRRQRPDAICVALHPGTVDTGLSQPFRRQGLDIQSPQTAAGRLLAVMDGLSPDDSGAFFDSHGTPVPF